MYPNRARLRPFTTAACLATTLSASAVWLGSTAHAGGFALIEHGASGLGNAYAGASAVSADGSTVWFNPAGMSEISGREISVALHLLNSETDWTDEGTRLGTRLGGGEVSGPATANPGTLATLPNLYYVAPINDKWSYGLSIGVPFGSSTEYDPDWKGRYTTLESGIQVVDINPALSYQVSDKFRLGFGISVQRLSAELGNSVDSGAVCLNFGGDQNVSFTVADCVNQGLTPGVQANDTTAEITGDSLALGFNLGFLYLPTENVKIGVAYRHSVEHDLDGDATFSVNGDGEEDGLRDLLDGNTNESTRFVTQNILTNGSGSAAVKLPAMLSLSGAWQARDKLELLADLTWTGWSSFDELRVVFDNQVQPDSFTTQEWEDVFRFSAGLNYRYNSKLTLRAGYAFDEEAIPSAQRRTARIPGNDRTWLSFGLGYQINKRISFDVGYAHLFLDDTPIDNPDDEQNGAGTFVRGIYEPSVDILSAQLNWDFY